MSFGSSSLAILARQAAGGAPDLNGPAGPPPNGDIPQLNNPPNGNHIAIPVITICTVLVAFLCLLRFWAKWQAKKINAADYLSMVAFPIFWVYIYYSYKLSWSPGYMIDMWNMKLKDIPEFSKVCWIATLLYFVLVALVKTAILLEWTDIFVVDTRKSFFAWACYATSAAICCLSTILFIMDMVNCTPFKRNYNPLVLDGHCRFDVPKFGLASAISNLVLDIVPILLAQNVIWKLRLSFAKKLGVSLVFLIGIIGIAICIIRVVYAALFFSSTNTTYFFSILGLCSLGETTCAILVLCGPFVPKAFVRFSQSKPMSQFKRSVKSSGGSGNNSDAFQEKSYNSKRSKPVRDPWESPETASSSSQEYLRDSGRMV